MTAYITTIARPDGTSWTTVETVDCRTLTRRAERGDLSRGER